ncbi:FeoA family protein [Trichothermofontia sp.]
MPMPTPTPTPTEHLAYLKPGHTATILSMDASPGLYHRLLALGFRHGRQVKMLRRSWWSGPVHVRVGTTEVMLRRHDAQRIGIAPLGHASAYGAGE